MLNLHDHLENETSLSPQQILLTVPWHMQQRGTIENINPELGGISDTPVFWGFTMLYKTETMAAKATAGRH